MMTLQVRPVEYTQSDKGDLKMATGSYDSPLVSVLMCVYNDVDYVSEAVQSILNQTFSNFEFIIIDDCSSQETRDILTRLNDDRIRLWRNSSNLGLTRSLNIGLSRCSGKFVARMDSDDISHPRRLEKQIQFLEANPDVLVLGTRVRCFKGKSNRRSVSGRVLATSSIVSRWQLLFDSPLAHSTAMFRREIIIKQLGGYDETVVSGQDFELWSRAKDVGGIINLKDPLLDLRTHESSVSKRYQHNDVLRISQLCQRNIDATLGVDPIFFGIGIQWTQVTNPRLKLCDVEYDALLQKIIAAFRKFQRLYQQEICHEAKSELRDHLYEKLTRVAIAASSISRLTALRLLFISTANVPCLRTYRKALSVFSLIIVGEDTRAMRCLRFIRNWLNL